LKRPVEVTIGGKRGGTSILGGGMTQREEAGTALNG